MSHLSISHLIKLTVFFSLAIGVYYFVVPGSIGAPTIISTLFLSLILLIFIQQKISFTKDLLFNVSYSILIFILLNIITLGRGLLLAQSNEDWKVLLIDGIPTMIILPLLISISSKRNYWQDAFHFFWKYGFWISLIFLIPTENKLNIFDFPHYASPIYIFILFIPYVNKKYKRIIILISIISLFSGLQVRSNIINIAIAYLIMFTFYFKRLKATLTLMKFSRIILLGSPFIFLLLGLLGIINIFKIASFFDEDSTSQESILIDSRTGIYTDVFSQLYIENAFIQGLGAYGKTSTYLNEQPGGKFDEIYEEGRRGTESGMLNFFQYSGIIGAFIYFAIFIIASSLCLNRSNNWLFVMLGLWLAYKGAFSFIEDRILFNTNTVFLFISIGLGYNVLIRESNEEIMKQKINYIFK